MCIDHTHTVLNDPLPIKFMATRHLVKEFIKSMVCWSQFERRVSDQMPSTSGQEFAIDHI